MMLKKLVLWAFILCAFIINLCSEDAREDRPRICKLIPNDWIEYPAIEPAIPSNYIMRTFEETGHILWGTKNDLQKFSGKEPAPTQSGIFALRFAEVLQTTPNSFSLSEKDLEEALKKLGMTAIKTQKIPWGNYPVLSWEAVRVDGSKARAAWIGLNSQNGWVLFVRLISSRNAKEDNRLWENYLKNTRQLDEPEFFLALGIDMREGYTIYKMGTASLKVKTEKNISDGQLAIMIQPLHSNTTFSLEKVEEGYMGTKWKYGAPCTKVYGCITENNGNSTNVMRTVITVLTKSVPSYSFDLQGENHPQNVTIFLKKLS